MKKDFQSIYSKKKELEAVKSRHETVEIYIRVDIQKKFTMCKVTFYFNKYSTEITEVNKKVTG